MATTGYSSSPATPATTATTLSVMALTAEVQRIRKQLAAIDETYVTDDDINKNDALENAELN